MFFGKSIFVKKTVLLRAGKVLLAVILLFCSAGNAVKQKGATKIQSESPQGPEQKKADEKSTKKLKKELLRAETERAQIEVELKRKELAEKTKKEREEKEKQDKKKTKEDSQNSFQKALNKTFSEKNTKKFSNMAKGVALSTFVGISLYGIIAAIQAGQHADKQARDAISDAVDKKRLERQFAQAEEGFSFIANPDQDLQNQGVAGLTEEELENRCPFFVSVESYDPNFSANEYPSYQVTYIRPYHLAPAGIAGSLENETENLTNKPDEQEETQGSDLQKSNQATDKKAQYDTVEQSLEQEVLRNPQGELAEILKMPPVRPRATLESLNLTYQALELAQKEILAAPKTISVADQEDNKELFISLERAQKELLAQRRAWYPDAPKITVLKSFYTQKKNFITQIEAEKQARAQQEAEIAAQAQSVKEQEKNKEQGAAKQQNSPFLAKLAAQQKIAENTQKHQTPKIAESNVSTPQANQ